MGITKQYLRFVPGAVFNAIANTNCILHIPPHPNVESVNNNLIATGACENVIVWDIRKSEKFLTLLGEGEEVTVFTCSPNGKNLAVGYANGFIRAFCLQSSVCSLTLHGHKSAVTSLSYNVDGTRLVSGSKDTELVIWDIINESGIVRFRGHKGPITKSIFSTKNDFVISSSTDTFIKFWDVETHHCFYTLVGHRSEVWDFLLLRNETCLIAGTSDIELHIWEIKCKDHENKSEDVVPSDDTDDNSILTCNVAGTLVREGKGRLFSLKADPTERVIGYHGGDSLIQLYLFLTEEEKKTRIKKRLKKQRRKKGIEDENETLNENVISVQDWFRKLPTINCQGKVKTIDITKCKNIVKIVAMLNNNSVDSYSLDLKTIKMEPEHQFSLWMPGHRSDVRTISFTSDNAAILSASGESVKLWNRDTQQCIRTIKCSYALTSCFTPGDRHCIIGTKNGKIQLFDLAAGVLLESFDCHEGPVWSVCLAPDQRGFVSGSGDHDVKFWDFEFVKKDESSTSGAVLSLSHSRTLTMSDDVLNVKFSPNQKLIAVALLDNTVKVFFVDTLKFFLSLYGHKLPVLCMDICYDNSLLITGSADRNVKIWGLTFGDCHRSLFAHDDSIMCLQFLPKTHLFFSGGKDGRINEWDADSYDKIITLKGHHKEIWALAVSPNGNHVVSASHDKSIRLWEKTQEPLILEEQREMEREEEYEKMISTEDDTANTEQKDNEATIAGHKNIETIKAAEQLIECLDIYKEENLKLEEYKLECIVKKKSLPPPMLHPLMIAYNASTPDGFFIEMLKKIKFSELEKALLILPFSYVIQLLETLSFFLEKGWETELVSRCLLFLMRIHHSQIVSNQVLVSVIEKLKIKTSERLHEIKDEISFNMAGLSLIKQEIEAKQQVLLFEDASISFGEKRKKKLKREQAVKRAILTL